MLHPESVAGPDLDGTTSPCCGGGVDRLPGANSNDNGDRLVGDTKTRT